MNENFFDDVSGSSFVVMMNEMDSYMLIALGGLLAVVLIFAVRYCLVKRGKKENVYVPIMNGIDCEAEGQGYGSVAALN